MPRPRTLESVELVHPLTGQTIVVQAHDDKDFGIILQTRDGEPREWGVTRNFTGGIGTRMKLREIHGVSEDAD